MTYHFVGIKGKGMSALAQIIYDLGYKVQGSDLNEYRFTQDNLIKKGIEILPFSKENIKDNLIIIRANDVTDDNEEIKESLNLGLKIYPYQDMLKRLTKIYKTVTVAGCHGKTTTASMLTHILKNTKGCNYLIGNGDGFAIKEQELFVLEACEYKKRFLDFNPHYAIVTNIDIDHPDCFKNIDEVIAAYQEYVKLADKMVIACGDDQYSRLLECNVLKFYYGLNDDNDIIAKDVTYSTEGISFDVFAEENYYGHFDLKIYGKHMLLNALAVIAICYYERVDAKEVAKYFKTFELPRRRYKEEFIDDLVIVEDNANHPTEIRAVIRSTKQKYPDKDIIIVFEPYAYSRTLQFAKDYIEIFNNIKHTHILPIHSFIENKEDFKTINRESIIEYVKNSSKIEVDDVKDLMNYKNSVILFLGHNDLSSIINKYKKELSN